MKIKELFIHGFKSFPDPTRIYFSRGINIIVGPNGQGKTNILDAILWALGEQSFSILRGEKNEDILFIGTKDRPPRNTAEVRLLLNMDGTSTKEEVEIRRKYYRDGESQYQINRKNVRLKDIFELFRRAGRSRKYIRLDENTVKEIITGKVKDRIIEMAGIEGYRVKKNEAITRLNQVSKNLDILDAQLSEREKIVRKLKREVSKLKRLKELKEEKKKYEFAEMYERYVRLKNSLDIKNKKTEELKNKIKIIKDKNSSIRRITDIFTKKMRDWNLIIQEMDIERNDLQKKLQEVVKKKENLEGQKKAKIDALNRLKSELGKLLNKQEEDIKNLENYENERDKNIKEKEELEEEIEELKKIIRRTNHIIHGIREKKARYRTLKEKFEAKMNSLKKRLEENLGNINRYRAIISRIDEEIREKEKELESLSNSLNSPIGYLEEICKLLERKIKEVSLSMENNKKEMESIKISMDTMEKDLRETLRRKESISGKLYGIEDEILKKIGVKGHIFSFISVPDEYTPALYSALSIYKKGLLIEEIENKNIKTDEEIFLFRDKECEMEPQSLSLPSLYSIARFKNGFPKPLMNYLKGIYIVDRIEDAFSLSEKYTSSSFVTKDGFGVFSSGMIFIPGKGKNEVEMALELKELKNKEEEIRKNISISEMRIKKLENELDKADRILKKLEISYEKYRQRLIIEKERMERNMARMNALKESIESRKEEFYEKKSNLMNLENSNNEISKELKDVEELYHKYEKIFNLYRNVERKFSDTSINNERKLNELLSKHTELTSRLEFLEKTMEIFYRERKKRGSEIEEKREEIKNLEDELIEIEKDLHKYREDEKEIMNTMVPRERVDKFNKRVELLGKKFEEFNRLMKENENQLKLLETELEELSKEREEEVIELTSLKENIINTTGRNPETDTPEVEPDPALLEKIKSKLERIGEVNPIAEEDYKRERENYEKLKKAREDIVKSKNELENMIKNVDIMAEESFRDKLKRVNMEFGKLYTEIFEEGKAEIVYDPTRSVWDTDVFIKASPKGRRIKTSLQSMGEKTLTAIAFLFSLHRVTPAPFLLIDEIDAPLDDMNVLKFRKLLEEIAKNTQIIIITHNRRTIEAADVLYGVTMEEKGVSKVLSLQLKQLKELYHNDK